MTAAALLSLALAAAPVADGTARSADGVWIRWHAERRGEPAVVLVHCWTCDRHLWDEQVAHLAPHRRVVTLDLAGHGESGTDRAAMTIAAFAGDVQAVVDELRLRRVVLVGHSMGGPVVVEAARRLRDHVEGVVLVDTLLNVDERMPPEAIAGFLKPLREDFPKAAEGFIRDYMFTPQSDPAVIARVIAATKAAPPAMALSALENTWSYDPRPALDEIHVPVRAINADKFPTNVEALRRHAPGFELAIVPGVGHYVMLERPAEFDRALDAALDAMEGSRKRPHGRAR